MNNRLLRWVAPAWIAVAGCAMTGAGKGSQGGTGQSGKAQVIIGTHIEMTAPEKEKCQRDLEKQGVKYSVESLFAEVARDRVEMVQAFLACGMSVETTGPDNWTLLHEAAKNGSDRTVRLLLDAHANVNARTTLYEVTPLSRAAGKGHTSTVGVLLAAGAEVEGYALILAAQGGNVDTIRALLAAHTDVNHRDGEKKTPLLWYFNGQQKPGVLDALIAAGADVNAVDDRGMSALFWAIQQGGDASVAALIAAHADVNRAALSNGHKETPLMHAVASGYLNIIKMLLAAGADVNAMPEDGQTALTRTVDWGKPDLVDVLLQAGADLKAPQGGRFLIGAAKNGWPALVRKALDAGADANTGAQGEGPPLVALLAAWTSTIDWLASAEVQDRMQADPVYAKERKDEFVQAAKARSEIACLLLRAGAKANLKNADGASANSLLKKLGFADAAEFRGKGCALSAKMPKRAR